MTLLWSSKAIEVIKDGLVFDRLWDQLAAVWDCFSGDPVEKVSPRNTGERREEGGSLPAPSESVQCYFFSLEMEFIHVSSLWMWICHDYLLHGALYMIQFFYELILLLYYLGSTRHFFEFIMN